MLKQFSINNLKSPRVLFIVITLFVFVLITLYFFATVFQKSAKKNEVYSKKYEAFPATERYVPNEIVVRFRDDYIPSDLMKKEEEFNKNDRNILGKTVNTWNSAQDSILKEKKPQEKLSEINDVFKKIGVVSFVKVYSTDDIMLRGFYTLKLRQGVDAINVQQELASVPFFYSSEPNNQFELFAVPNDPNYSQLWGMEKIQAPLAWDMTKGSGSVVVAVIDSGIEASHADLSANAVAGYDFANGDSNPADDVGHGTHVAGTVGAVGNNSVGVTGVNWTVKIMPLKVCVPYGSSASCDTTATTQAISYAADNGAKVINMSLGGRTPCRQGSQYDTAITYAVSKGVLVVVAAGNGHPTTHVAEDAGLYSPASCSGALAVGATTPTDSRASFSNFGSFVGISAPGTGIISTWPGGGYKSSQGTSMASPHVAGAAALLLAAKPSLSASQVKDCLIQGAEPISTDRPIGPRLNVYKAMQACGSLTALPTVASTLTPSVSTTIVPSLTISPTATFAPLPTVLFPTPTPTLGAFKQVGTPTPTPDQYFSCVPDPKCTKNGKSIQICPLICSPR